MVPKHPRPLSLLPVPLPLMPPSAQPKCQIMKAVHVEVAKEHEGIAVNLIHKALQSTAFRFTTNLMMKLVPLFSDCLPSMEQNILCHTITKHMQCPVEFEYVNNSHINLLFKPSVALSNQSLCSIVLAYCHNQKKTFLSLDWDHSTSQVILTYPWKYQSEGKGHAHNLVHGV